MKIAEKKNELAVVILNYNSAVSTIDCVNRVNDISDGLVQIIIVDNHSNDNSLESLNEITSKNVLLIESGINGGYAYGNNLGLKEARKLGAKYAAIMNPDIEFDDDVFTPLKRYMDCHENVGIAAPALVSQTEGINYGEKIHLGKISFNEKVSNYGNQPIENIDSIVGACFIVKLSILDFVGYIPEVYFLNFEETEWCLTMKKAGYKIVCLPDFQVFHREHESINKVSGLQVYFLRRNLVLFNKRLDSRELFVKFVLKVIVFGIAQSIKNCSFLPLLSYVDGITGKNRFLEKSKCS